MDSSTAQERRWHWKFLVENAAASEIIVNVCLPWLVCEFNEGMWRHSSAVTQCSMVLILNLSGSFLEGICKSARVLSGKLRTSQTNHRLVWVTSRSYCDGFLNVLTSFTDIAGGGTTIALTTSSTLLGVAYCFTQMLGGIVLYRWGRDVGWKFVQSHWERTLQICRIWRMAVRGLTMGACILMFFLEAGGVPLDLSKPELVGCPVRIVYDEYVVSLPPMILGLFVGMFMSASGAIIAVLFCDVFFSEQSRSAARFLANCLATVLVVIVQQVDVAEEFVAVSFISVKFATSFCGSLSAFSGTIGDVSDTLAGKAAEQGMYKGERSWLPALSGLGNFSAHMVLTLVVMGFGVVWAPAPLENMEREWVREVQAPAWGQLRTDV